MCGDCLQFCRIPSPWPTPTSLAPVCEHLVGISESAAQQTPDHSMLATFLTPSTQPSIPSPTHPLSHPPTHPQCPTSLAPVCEHLVEVCKCAAQQPTNHSQQEHRQQLKDVKVYLQVNSKQQHIVINGKQTVLPNSPPITPSSSTGSSSNLSSSSTVSHIDTLVHHARQHVVWGTQHPQQGTQAYVTTVRW